MAKLYQLIELSKFFRNTHHFYRAVVQVVIYFFVIRFFVPVFWVEKRGFLLV